MSLKSVPLFLVSIGALASAADAAPTFYFDRATWHAALTAPTTTESLDSFAEDVNPVVTPSGVTLQINGLDHGPELEGFTTYISEGSSSLLFHHWHAGESVVITLPQPVTAFAIDLLDDSPPFDLDLTVNGQSQNYASAQAQTRQFNGPLFLGVIDTTPFTQATIVTNTSPLGVNLDYIQFTTYIPEPSTAALASLLGVSSLTLTRRRR